MFDLSSKTRVDKKFKMTELFKLIGADKDIKLNAKNVISVTLENVLSKDTMNLPSGELVKEIYIFNVELESKDIPTTFISALDKSINLHTVFIFNCGEEQILYGAYKEKGDKSVKVGKYYQTEWEVITEKKKVPFSVSSLDDVYTFLIDELIPITARQGESTLEFVVRYGDIIRLKKEIAKKQKQVDNERQPKKRFELNDELKKLKKELESLEN